MERGDISVVLIEDNVNDAELTLRALRGIVAREQVLLLEDGAQAAEFLFGPSGVATRGEVRLPPLVLLDLKIPKVDGLELLRRIKSDPRTRSLPVVVLTSSREVRDVRESYRGGANSYVVKPVGFQEYLAAVGDIGRYWLSVNQPPPSERCE